MAEPARLYDDDNQEPVVNPKLDVLEGGGESTEPKRGHLKSVEGGAESPEELQAAESAGGTSDQGKVDSKEKALADKSDQVGSGYNEEKDKRSGRRRRFSLTRRQKLIGGGVSGGLIGLLMVIFSFSSGPFQFIHIAQLLQRFHFASLEDTGDSRTLSLYKYARNARQGNVANARLGIIEKRIATKFDDRLKEVGIQKNYADTFGAQYEGITVDKDKFAGSPEGGDDFKNLSDEDFISKFEEKHGVKLQSVEGKLVATNKDIGGFFKNRRLNKMLSRAAGYDRIPGSIAARIMGRRDNVQWHPIRKLDAKITGAVDSKLSFSKWAKNIKERITKGATKEIDAKGKKKQDGKPDSASEGTANETDRVASAASDAADEADELTEAGSKAGSEAADGFISKITSSTAGKLTIGVTTITGIVCGLKALGDNIDDLRHDMVVLPLIRTGVQAMSVGNQVMNGKDMDNEQLSFYSRLLTDKKGTSWASAKSIQAELGQPTTGKDIPKSASIKNLQKDTFFSGALGDVLESAPVGIICEVSESIIGQIINFAVSALTPISSLATFAFSQTDVAKDALGDLVRWLAGSPIPALVFGPDYGNYVNYGARLGANNAQASLGGVKLSGTQSAELKQFRIAKQKEEFSHQSLAKKIFDPYSPDSLMAKAIDQQSPELSTNVSNIFSKIISPTKIFGSLGSIFYKNTQAASDYDYGFPEMGFSLNDLQSDSYDDPYSNGDQAINILSGENGQEYIERAQKCFGVTIDTQGNVKSDLKTSLDPLKKDYDDNGCSSDTSEEWTRVRFLVLDTKIAEAADCYGSNDPESCAAVGFGSASGSSTTTPNGSCGPGTTSVGEADGYKDGQLTKVQLCSIPNTPSTSPEATPGTPYHVQGADGHLLVNAEISAKIFQMVEDAKKQGVILTAKDGFRSMAQQEYFWNCYQTGSCNNGNKAAPPGYSNHQMGLAIDFGCNGASFGGACLTWMQANGANYGLSAKVADEPWHWSVGGN